MLTKRRFLIKAVVGSVFCHADSLRHDYRHGGADDIVRTGCLRSVHDFDIHIEKINGQHNRGL